MRRLAVLSLLLCAANPARAQQSYGAKGIYPVYESSGRWVIFNKHVGDSKPLAKGERFLVIGSKGAGLLAVERFLTLKGAACRAGKPVALPAAVLSGPRRPIGEPIIAIRVSSSFNLKRSRAVYRPLPNQVNEQTYQKLGDALRRVESEATGTKIDFGSIVSVRGLEDAFVFIEETQTASGNRRCLRLALEGTLIGECAEMPQTLMAETAQLRFVFYDPGADASFVLGYNQQRPLWGDERWGFVVRNSGPQLFLMDALDPRCRESF